MHGFLFYTRLADNCEAHFGDEAGNTISVRVALVEKKEFITANYEDSVLGRLSLMTTEEVNFEKEASADGRKGLQDFGVKNKIIENWTKTNDCVILNEKGVQQCSRNVFEGRRITY